MVKNSKRLCVGFAAVMAALTFSFIVVSCSGNSPGTEEEEDVPFSGVVTISPNESVYAGTFLNAAYSGTETGLGYQWNKNGAAVSGAAGPAYKPASGGNYTVTVSKSGYVSKTSAAVAVLDAVVMNVDDLTVFGTALAELTGDSAESPITIKLQSADPLATQGTAPANSIPWGDIEDKILAAGKYVIVDLTACSFTDNAVTTSVLNGINTSNKYFKGIDFPSGITEIRGFSSSPYLARVSGAGVTSIEDWAFQNCPSLTSVDFPKAASMGMGAFSSCTSLKRADFPLVTTIGGDRAFQNCTSLTSVNLPLVVSLGQMAFENCISLMSADFPKAETIPAWTFRGCTSLVSVNFPAAASISSTVFENCVGLKTVNVPKAASIGGSVFAGCTGLTSVNFPQAASLGTAAFRGCTSLTSVNLPALVFSNTAGIAPNAFENCASLGTITLGAAAPMVGNDCFTGIAEKTITVRIPRNATGYDAPETDFPKTYDEAAEDCTPNWANGFRGKGWVNEDFHQADAATPVIIRIEEI